MCDAKQLDCARIAKAKHRPSVPGDAERENTKKLAGETLRVEKRVKRIPLENGQQLGQFFLLSCRQFSGRSQEVWVVDESNHRPRIALRNAALSLNGAEGASAEAFRISATNSGRYAPSASSPTTRMSPARRMFTSRRSFFTSRSRIRVVIVQSVSRGGSLDKIISMVYALYRKSRSLPNLRTADSVFSCSSADLLR